MPPIQSYASASVGGGAVPADVYTNRTRSEVEPLRIDRILLEVNAWEHCVAVGPFNPYQA